MQYQSFIKNQKFTNVKISNLHSFKLPFSEFQNFRIRRGRKRFLSNIHLRINNNTEIQVTLLLMVLVKQSARWILVDENSISDFDETPFHTRKLTVFQHLNIADDNLADVAQRIWSTGVQRFQNPTVVYARLQHYVNFIPAGTSVHRG